MTHEDYMKRALELAKTAMGHTSPNPMVGCVVVKGGRIVAEGCHEKYGAFHAERNALTAPRTPSGVKAVTDEDSATVSWDPSEGATGYGVSVDGKEYHTTANSLKVNNLTPNTDHSYQVKAKNAGGSSSFGAPKNAKTTPKAPASPKEETTKNDITVSWDPVDGATSYDVKFDDKGT